jgi:hypothetical protein
MRTVEHLAGRLGPRPAGGEAEYLASQYIVGRLADVGLGAECRSFLFRGWRPHPGACVHVTDGPSNERNFAAVPLPYTSATPAAGCTGRLVRQGTWPIIAGRLLCPRYLVIGEEGIPGAAVIVTEGDPRPLPNPLPLLVLPTVCISSSDEACLTELALGDRGVPVTVVSPPPWEGPLWSRNVIAQIGRDDRVLSLCAHYDSAEDSPGANDNASGVALLLRLAERIPRWADGAVGIRLAFYGAEEPLFVGSRLDVSELQTSGALPRVAACLNFDMVGVGDAFHLRCAASSIWAQLGAGLRKAKPVDVALRVVPATAASDHWSFYEAGVDSAQLTRVSDPRYHCPTDTEDRVAAAALDEAEDLAAALVAAFMSRPGS